MVGPIPGDQALDFEARPVGAFTAHDFDYVGGRRLELLIHQQDFGASAIFGNHDAEIAFSKPGMLRAGSNHVWIGIVGEALLADR